MRAVYNWCGQRSSVFKLSLSVTISLCPTALHCIYSTPTLTVAPTASVRILQTTRMLNKALPSQPIGSAGHMNRSVSESFGYSSPTTTPKMGSFSHFLRRKKYGSVMVDSDRPPPTPPKDSQTTTSQFSSGYSPPEIYSEPEPEPLSDPEESAYLAYHSPKSSHDFDQSQYHAQERRLRRKSVPDVVHITRDESDMVVIEPQRPSMTLEARWAAEPFAISDPAERARRRNEAKLLKEEAERRAVEEEAERQRLLKLKKEAMFKQEREEELQRRAMLDQQLKEATAERIRREREMEEEEQMKAWETAEKKKADKERRAEESRRLEEWRIAEERRKEEMKREREQERQRKEQERITRVKAMGAQIRKNSTAEMTTGWVTTQSSDALVLTWRRRFFSFVGTTMYFYRSPKVR